MTDPIAIWKRDDGCFAWMPEHTDDLQQAMAGICEEMEGSSDEEIDDVIRAYLASLLDARNAIMH